MPILAVVVVILDAGILIEGEEEVLLASTLNVIALMETLEVVTPTIDVVVAVVLMIDGTAAMVTFNLVAIFTLDMVVITLIKLTFAVVVVVVVVAAKISASNVVLVAVIKKSNAYLMK